MSCRAKPRTTALTADVVTSCWLRKRRRQQDQRDDERVLEDRGKPVRHAIGAQRVDEEEDDGVDQRRRERELGERGDLRLRFRRHAVAVKRHRHVGGDESDEQDEESRSFRRMSLLTVRLISPSVAAMAAAPRIRCSECAAIQ